MLTCAGIFGIRSEHPAELFDDRVALELRNGCPRELLRTLLRDLEVLVGERRDLRQVRDAKHLTVASKRAQLFANCSRGVPSDAGVDLVEAKVARPAAGAT